MYGVCEKIHIFIYINHIHSCNLLFDNHHFSDRLQIVWRHACQSCDSTTAECNDTRPRARVRDFLNRGVPNEDGAADTTAGTDVTLVLPSFQDSLDSPFLISI